eukprot:1195950-Prorocentrum_minimum.AAC.1
MYCFTVRCASCYICAYVQTPTALLYIRALVVKEGGDKACSRRLSIRTNEIVCPVEALRPIWGATAYRRKDFLETDEDAKSHPNRNYYYRKNAGVDKLIEACTQKLQINPTNTRALFIRASSYVKRAWSKFGQVFCMQTAVVCMSALKDSSPDF